MSEPRTFNASQRSGLWLASGGACEMCGVELEPGWHADHVTPYCSTFLRLDPKAVETLLDASMFKAAAGEVRRMLREDVQPVGKQGRPGKGGDTTITRKDENDATYVLARLKRDRPDLAAEVIAGTLTANAAAVDAGIRHRYARIRTDDLDQAVAVLCRHYDPQQIRSALEAAS